MFTLLELISGSTSEPFKEMNTQTSHTLRFFRKAEIICLKSGIVEAVKQILYTGHIGDGKIFVYSLDNVIKVRTGDEGIDAL